jgi:hypothetical protein
MLLPWQKFLLLLNRLVNLLDSAVHNVFSGFSRVNGLLHASERVFIKVNAVYFHPHLHTSLSVIESVVEYIKRIDPEERIYLMSLSGRGKVGEGEGG